VDALVWRLLCCCRTTSHIRDLGSRHQLAGPTEERKKERGAWFKSADLSLTPRSICGALSVFFAFISIVFFFVFISIVVFFFFFFFISIVFFFASKFPDL
jgi:hypothetical protein